MQQVKNDKFIGDLFNLLPDPILVFNKMESDSIIFSSINQNGIKTFGKQILQFLGKNLSSLEQLFPELSNNIQLVMNSGTVVSDKFTVKVNGSTEEKTFFGDYIKTDTNTALLITKDFTELESLEKELQEHEEFNYQQLAEYSPLGIMNLNAEGKVIFANPTSTQLFGWINEQITLVEGQNIFDFPFISEQPNIVQGINELLKGDPLVGVEFPITIKHQLKFLKAYGSPRYGSNGSLAGAILMYTDITDLKTTEEKLKRQKEELSDFAHQMSHDLGNSIMGILGYAEFMNKYNDYSHLEEVIKHANKMTKILRQSLELADSGLLIDKKDEVDLNFLVDEVAELTIPETITFLCTKLPVVNCDKTKLIQVFENLFRNAVIHGEPKEITLKDDISIEAETRGRVISIINDGNVITQENREKLFDRGFSSKRGRKGLGMYIVKRIIEAHGWTIKLSSSKTTTFNIFIPDEDR